MNREDNHEAPTMPTTPEIASTSSRMVPETMIHGSYRFVLPGYSMAKGMGIGKRIASDDFIVGGHKWAIYFYPDGQCPEDDSTYVSVFISLVSEGTDVRALFELSLLDQSGRGKHKVVSQFNRSLERGPYTFKFRGSMWGYKRFFRRALLESSDFLKDDCLKITCTVGVVVSAVDCSRLHLIQVPDSDTESDFGMLLENMEGSDVTYSVAGEKFHAHKLVLAARSPGFCSEFFEELDRDGQDITVLDMEPKVFKINDRYEFPLELDLDRENGKYLSPEADRSIRNVYTLHSALVQSGAVHGGHYYAFIRPTLSDQWYTFDDERVTKEYVKRALEEQYGGEEELPQTNPGYNNTPLKFTKYSNAYLLVYIRVNDKDKITCDVDEKDIAEHLQIRLKKEQEENEDKRRYKAQAHLYTIIKVARDEDLREQIGKDIYFDLVDHDKVCSFPIQKQMPFNLFKEEVAKKSGIPVKSQRFWLWAKRQNHIYHPNQPLTLQEEAQTIRECDGLSSLMLMLRSEDDVVRYEAVEAIGNLIHSSPNIKKEVLASTFCLEKPREAVLLLGQFLGSDEVVKGHIQILPSIEISNSQLRSMANFALSRHLYRCGTPRPSIGDQIVSLLESFESNNDLKQHEASFTLYGIIDSEENVPEFVRVGGVQKLQEDGLILLQEIRDCVAKTIERVEEHIHGEVVLDHLLDMMSVENQITQRRVVLALANLCSPHDQRKVFIENNGLLLLLEIMHSRHWREGCRALCSIAKKIRKLYPRESAPSSPSEFLNSFILSDVIFAIEGQLFHGHRSCLCESSEVFRAMFYGQFLERDAEKIVIPNIRSDVFELMMSYIYTGCHEISFHMAHDLARAADQYMLSSLKHLCEDTISQELTIDNVYLMYELSNAINGMRLMNSCVVFSVENYDLTFERVWFPQLMKKISRYFEIALS